MAACGLAAAWVAWGGASESGEAERRFQRGAYEDAAVSYARLAARQPGSVEAWDRLGASYAALGRWHQSAEAFARATDVDAGNPRRWLRLAWSRFEAREYEAAVRSFARGGHLDPRATEACHGLGLAYAALHDYESAFRVLSPCAARDPGSLAVAQALGEVAFALHRGDSLDHLSRAAALAAEHATIDAARTHYMMGVLHCEARRLAACDGEMARTERILSRKMSSEWVRPPRLVGDANAPRLAIDFGRIVDGGPERYARALTGQRVALAGGGTPVAGPRPGDVAMMFDDRTRVLAPVDAIDLREGTIAMWGRLRDPRRRYSDLVAVYAIAGAGAARVIYIYHRGQDGRVVVGFNQSMVGESRDAVRDVQWHHYAFTWRRGDQRFFIDGRDAASNAHAAPDAQAASFAIGWLGEGDTEQWGGAIGDVRVYPRALSAADVRRLAWAKDPP